MENKLKVSPGFIVLVIVLIVYGLVTVIIGFATGDTVRTWANLLLNNYYFMSIAIGAAFWLAIQYITQSGWSAQFLRIPMAMSDYLIVSFVLWIMMFFGLHHLYEWTHLDVVANDHILMHKQPYLNVPFFAVRYIVFFGLWIYLTQRLKKLSLLEDKHGGLIYFKKMEFNSKVFIFVFAITFSLFSIDWLMSLDPHWYSTIYAVKKFIMAFYHGATIITAIVIILYFMGYFPEMNKTHFLDFSRYIFALSIIWGYMWISQYLLIWYANIPEETIYYVPRVMTEYKPYFYAELIINWLFPFLFLMWNRIAKNPYALLFAVVVLMCGQWVELYMSIMPNTTSLHKITYIEFGTFIGFLGVFAGVVAWSLSRMNLIPKNHPYLIESVKHHG